MGNKAGVASKPKNDKTSVVKTPTRTPQRSPRREQNQVSVSHTTVTKKDPTQQQKLSESANQETSVPQVSESKKRPLPLAKPEDTVFGVKEFMPDKLYDK